LSRHYCLEPRLEREKYKYGEEDLTEFIKLVRKQGSHVQTEPQSRRKKSMISAVEEEKNVRSIQYLVGRKGARMEGRKLM